MRWGVITFPGSCDDQDVFDSLKIDLEQKVKSLWHKDELAGDFDCIVLPGGFSYGDYLRCGAMARFSPIMQRRSQVRRERRAGARHLQWLSNPLRSRVCCPARWCATPACSLFASRCICASKRPTRRLPRDLKKGQLLQDAGQTWRRLLFRRRRKPSNACTGTGKSCCATSMPRARPTPAANPNGSLENIAGICNEKRNVFGLMPHPEDACNKLLGSEDGAKIFSSIAAARRRERRSSMAEAQAKN